MTTYDIAIIGAGASGLMLASQLQDKNVCLIDKNSDIGAKIKISGGAKCNITNKYLSSDKFLGNEEFIDEVFNSFNNKDLLNFLNKNGVYPNLNEKIVKGTYFCNSSLDVIDMFRKLTKKTKLYLETIVNEVTYNNNYYEIQTNNNTIRAKKLVLASGGLSYASIGATDIGFKIASSFGHNIIIPKPALVGFTVQKDQFWFKDLSGLSVDVSIKINDKKIDGMMLFTHKGCSGPAILSTSLYWKKGQFSIDFAPTKDSYLPKRFKKAIKDMNMDIHNYSMAPAGNFGYTKAEVTSGGVDIDEVDVKSMESKLQKDLYFLGEVLDVTGELGGYNFQWAFSTAQKMANFIKISYNQP